MEQVDQSACYALKLVANSWVRISRVLYFSNILIGYLKITNQVVYYAMNLIRAFKQNITTDP
jgi:hypothetical protein